MGSEKAALKALIRKLRLRLRQADRIAAAARASEKGGQQELAVRQMEDIEEVLRDAGHLVAAALVLRYPETGDGD
ncbi:hypothetical protein [Cucumibacter marinus]|uniref:hypothetical protein n=1 Tax=Cucumibacter marinus TaxID=1121252 RepID=UPI0003FEAA99|nr:hypothetical protein [Cucumibacter marinus]